MGKLWTVQKTGALIDDAQKWEMVDWDQARRRVRRLQVRIAKAVQKGKWGKVRKLQYLQTRSFYAKLLAVKRVTSNKGKKTPGIDGILWQGTRAKWRAIHGLHKRGYKPKPLRRIYIPKKNGKKRPLSIPTMKDRAMQALYKMALSPIAETIADRNSYGFREGRSCHDAIAAAFNALSKPNSATWILEGDIKGCFDNISHEWMMKNIPTDKTVLRKWLKAGYVENGATYPTRKGTPQGGIISPTLSNMTLDGMEEAIRNAVPRRSRVNFVRYADDFIVTGKSKRLLTETVMPAIRKFLSERGLTLSEEKTAITRIEKGFSFLGQTFRKHGRRLHVTPSAEGVLVLRRKIGTLTRKYVSAPMTILIKKLNETLRGWANYHKYGVTSEAFSRIDTYVWEQLWRMLRRRHNNKSKRWLFRQYWSASGREHIFAVSVKNKEDRFKVYKVFRTCSFGTNRYIKIIAKANPYLKEYAGYFWRRRRVHGAKELSVQTMREIIAERAT